MKKIDKMLTRKVILLGAIAILLVTYILQLSLTGRNKVKTVSFADTPDSLLIVKGSEAANPSNSWRLQYENSAWYAGEKKYSADSAAAQNMAETLKNIKLLGVIASAPGNAAEKYGLGDSEKYTVTAFKDGKVLRTIVVGKDTASGGQSYIQVDGKSSVYLAEGSFHSLYGVNVDAVRSKDVYSLNAAEIMRVNVITQEGSFTAVKNMPQTNIADGDNAVAQEPVWEIAERTYGEDVEVDSSKIESWVNTISNLKAASWAADNESFTGKELIASVVIGAGAKEVSVQVYSIPEDSEGRYLCKSSTSQYPFYLTKYNTDRFNKTIGDLMMN